MRLDVIRTAVRDAIVQLAELEHGVVVGRELSASERTLENSPICEALTTCCDELREECGIAKVRELSERERLGGLATSQQWVDSYSDALNKYRHAAGAALERALREAEAPR